MKSSDEDELNFQYGNPFEDTIWENLTLDEYCQMDNEEKQRIKDFLEEIDAPFETIWEIDGMEYLVSNEHPTWRRILSWEEEDIQKYNFHLKEQEEAAMEYFERSKNCAVNDETLPF